MQRRRSGVPATTAAPANRGAVRIPVIRASAIELAAHEKSLDAVERASHGRAIFRAGTGRGT